MNLGKHRDDPTGVAERYGRHSEANAQGPSALELLQRAILRGEGIRLAWRGDDVNAVSDATELPTAVLPTVREPGRHEQGADSQLASRPPQADDQPPRAQFDWWPLSLAG